VQNICDPTSLQTLLARLQAEEEEQAADVAQEPTLLTTLLASGEGVKDEGPPKDRTEARYRSLELKVNFGPTLAACPFLHDVNTVAFVESPTLEGGTYMNHPKP
jgi:hypothetical protein